MSKKLFFIILIPAILLVGGFVFLQARLRTDIKKEEKTQEYTVRTSDTLNGKKVSEADLRPLFIQRMQQLLKKSTNGLYDLTVGDLKVDVLASTISLHNVTVRPDEQRLQTLKAAGLLPSNVLSFSFNKFLIEGVNLDDALTSKTMDYKLVRLVNPVITIEKESGKKEAQKEGEFSQQFLKEMKKLSIGKLVVEGGDIVVIDKQKGGTKKLSNVQVLMNNILLDSTTRKDKDRFLFAKEARIDFEDFNTKSKDGLYNLKIGNVAVNATQKQVTLKNLSYASTLSKEAFQKKNKVAKEMYAVSLPRLTISGVDWWPAINGEEVVAKEAEIRGGKLSVYLDRSMPPTSKMGNFPNQMLMKLPLKLNISQLRIRNLDFAYEEFNPLSQQSGTVYLDNTSIDISNIENGPGGKAPMRVNASALFMHQVPVNISFQFDMNNAKSGSFNASMSTGKAFDGTLLNSFAMPLGMMKIEKGELQKLQATMSGNESGSSGTVLFPYKDLKLSMLEKEKEKAELDRKNVTSLFANLFVLKNDNPKGGKEIRKEQAQFQRDPNGGFMQLVWKTMLVGLLKTIGAPEKAAYKKGK